MKKSLILLGFLIVVCLRLFSFQVLASVDSSNLSKSTDFNCYYLEESTHLEHCKNLWVQNYNQSLENQAQQFYQQGEFNQSLLLLQQALQQYQAQNHKIGRVRVLRNIAFIHLKKQNFEAAQTAILSSLRLLEELKTNSEYQ